MVIIIVFINVLIITCPCDVTIKCLSSSLSVIYFLSHTVHDPHHITENRKTKQCKSNCRRLVSIEEKTQAFDQTLSLIPHQIMKMKRLTLAKSLFNFHHHHPNPPTPTQSIIVKPPSTTGLTRFIGLTNRHSLSTTASSNRAPEIRVDKNHSEDFHFNVLIRVA